MALFDAAIALDRARLTVNEPAPSAMMTGDGAPPAGPDPAQGSAGQAHDEAPPAQQSDAAETAFDTSATFDGLDISADVKPGLDAIGASLASAGVSNFAVHHVADWLLALREADRAGEDIDVPARHSYNISHRFPPSAQATANWFLNSMHAAKASQADVDAILSWYQSNQGHFTKASADASRAVERFDMQDRASTERVMREEWGNEYTGNIKLITAYLDRLPAAEREQIERGTIDGRRALNDPERLRELAKLARGGTETRADIEKMMGDRYSKYWKGPDAERLQARYRDMLRGNEKH